MPVGIIDVGSNTIRLLVAARSGHAVVPLRQERAYVGLGAEILHHGVVRPERVEAAASTVRAFARLARTDGVATLEVMVTAPGRQARNGDELVDAVARAARASAHLLSAEEEAALAYRGAVAAAGSTRDAVAVCDVGGGSTELAIGVPPEEPVWLQSFDLGSLRLTTAFLSSDPPARAELRAAEEAVAAELGRVYPPRPAAALAVGGSARAVARLVGGQLGEPELSRALALATERRAAKVAKTCGLDEERARVVPAGVLILRAVVRRLGVPFALGRGGLREGAASLLLARMEAGLTAQAGGGR